METADRVHIWGGLEELRDPLRFFLSRHCRDESEIDDVIQDTLVRAARYRSNLTETGRLRSWTMRIALNVLSDARRRGRRFCSPATAETQLEALEAREPSPEVYASEPEFRFAGRSVGKEVALEHLARATATLQDDDRRVLASFYGGPQSCRFTARECSIPPHLVKVRLFRARQRLLRAVRRSFARSEQPILEEEAG